MTVGQKSQKIIPRNALRSSFVNSLIIQYRIPATNASHMIRGIFIEMLNDIVVIMDMWYGTANCSMGINPIILHPNVFRFKNMSWMHEKTPSMYPHTGV